jgi:hypothetical protein
MIEYGKTAMAVGGYGDIQRNYCMRIEKKKRKWVGRRQRKNPEDDKRDYDMNTYMEVECEAS